MRKENPKFFTEWAPFIIDGVQVNVFFPSAYASDDFVETKAEDVEQALLATYQKADDK